MKQKYKVEKRLKDLDELVEISTMNGTWNYNSYLHGMANGMILAQATIKGTEPVFLETPKNWLEDRPSPLKPSKKEHKHNWELYGVQYGRRVEQCSKCQELRFESPKKEECKCHCHVENQLCNSGSNKNDECNKPRWNPCTHCSPNLPTKGKIEELQYTEWDGDICLKGDNVKLLSQKGLIVLVKKLNEIISTINGEGKK